MRARPLRAPGACPPAGHRRTTLLYHAAQPAVAACRFTSPACRWPLQRRLTLHGACCNSVLACFLRRAAPLLAATPHPALNARPPGAGAPGPDPQLEEDDEDCGDGRRRPDFQPPGAWRQCTAGAGGLKRALKPNLKRLRLLLGLEMGIALDAGIRCPSRTLTCPRSCSCLPAARCLVGTSPSHCSCWAATAAARHWRAWPWSWRTGGGGGGPGG